MTAHKIDYTKGERVGTVNAQWASRPDDQKFLDLSSLKAQVQAWAEASRTEDIAPGALTITHKDGGLLLGHGDLAMEMTHYSFDKLAQIAKAPANYLRSLPPQLAAVNMNYGLRAAAQSPIQAYLRDDGAEAILRGITSPRYGRIFDHEVVDAVMKVAGNGTGDARWKVPGTIDWGGAHGVTYNPKVDITKENTTLYASDRDIFLFLVDDMNPIEVGKLDDGSPDLMFRGFYCWNSEVGDKSFGVATMYLRGVCQNRNLWGVEGFNEVTFRHTAGAPSRFIEHAAPALTSYAEGSTAKVIEGVKTANGAKVSSTDEERLEFLAKLGFSEKQAKELIATSVAEEGRPPETVWDHAQAITAQARGVQLQEQRLKLERVAGDLLTKVTA